MNGQQTAQSGFTLVEMLVVLFIIVILLGFSMVNLGGSQSSASINTTIDTLLSDLKSQQMLAMAGGKGGAASAQAHGLHIEANTYTLFAGTSYNGSDSNNFVVNAGNNITFTTTLPSAQIVFAKGDGSVTGFTNGSNTVTIRGLGTASRTITINRFGATTVN